MTDAVIIAALSARALAQSARLAGMKPVVLDVFLDSDTREYAQHTSKLEMDGRSLSRYSLQKQLEALPESYARSGLVFGSGLENAIDVIDAWSYSYPVYGNSAEVLRCVNNARQYFALLEALEIRHPETRFSVPPDTEPNWLVKQQYSAGGIHVQHYYAGMDGLSPECYFQRFVIGTPVSLLFAADGIDVYEVGFNTQWITSCGEYPFSYRGAVNRTTLSSSQKDEIRSYAERLTTTLGLRGLNTLDCMLTPTGITVLELNPRPGASLSLYDVATTNGLLQLHISACLGKLPVNRNFHHASVRACEIIYASRTVIISDDFVWPEWCADRPMPASLINPGDPVCSIYAEAETLLAVEQKLKSCKATISARLYATEEAA